MKSLFIFIRIAGSIFIAILLLIAIFKINMAHLYVIGTAGRTFNENVHFSHADNIIDLYEQASPYILFAIFMESLMIVISIIDTIKKQREDRGELKKQ